MDDFQEFQRVAIRCSMNGQQDIRRYTRARSRREMLDVDLNSAPPCETRDQDVISSRTRSQDRQAVQEGHAAPSPPIDVDAFDDDVVISSPGAFAEAKNNSRRNRARTIVVDVDCDDRPSRNKRRRVPANQTIINCDFYINLEGSSDPKRKNGQRAAVPPLVPPPPKEPAFSCPVCMGPLVEEMTTKCGHIFCKACIKAAIAAQSKCPTCRRKTTVKDIIRVYLPATRSS